jgi:hypothetical protein
MSVRTRLVRLSLLLLCAGLFASCSKGSAPVGPTPPPAGPVVVAPPAFGSGVLVGAGDIGDCGPGSEATARLLDRLPGTIFAAGDTAYSDGTREEFQRCYEPTWGRHRGRTRPAPGNHEYNSGGAAYYEYFGASAGPALAGYYSFAVGPWNVISLNSEVASGRGSAQNAWLRGELSSNRSACTAVYWHRPRFSSGRHGDNGDMRDLWQTLYEFDVDLVINGHDHTYERFAPQDPDGRFDPARGIREFVVGTGGASLYQFPSVHANSEVRGAAWGVAMFTLRGGGYDWEFLPVDGQSFRDSGSATCH